MAKKVSKKKKQKYIAKIMSDGKITKEEGQRAANKGISLQKIQNTNINNYCFIKKNTLENGKQTTQKRNIK